MAIELRIYLPTDPLPEDTFLYMHADLVNITDDHVNTLEKTFGSLIEKERLSVEETDWEVENHFRKLNRQYDLVAVVDGKYAGFASFQIHFGRVASWSWHNGLIYGVLQLNTIYVRPGYRERRVGTAIYNALKAFAQENSCSYIKLEVAVENKRAYNWYQQLGFKTLEKHLYGVPISKGEYPVFAQRVSPENLTNDTQFWSWVQNQLEEDGEVFPPIGSNVVNFTRSYMSAMRQELGDTDMRCLKFVNTSPGVLQKTIRGYAIYSRHPLLNDLVVVAPLLLHKTKHVPMPWMCFTSIMQQLYAAAQEEAPVKLLSITAVCPEIQQLVTRAGFQTCYESLFQKIKE